MVEHIHGRAYTRWSVYTMKSTHGGLYIYIYIEGPAYIWREYTHERTNMREDIYKKETYTRREHTYEKTFIEGYKYGDTCMVVYTHNKTYIKRRHTYGGIYTLSRYTYKRSNIRRVIHIKRFTQRGHTHKKTNIQKEIHTEGAYTKRGHIHKGKIYMRKQIYKDIYT